MTLPSDHPRFIFHVATRATHLGLSQMRLSQRAELSRDTIQRYWTNTIQRPDILVLHKLAQVLRCRVADLIAIDEPADG